MKHILVLSTLLALQSAAFAEQTAEPNRATDTVILDEAALANLRLETVEVEERDFDETVFVLGRIKVAPGHRAVVSSRVPGRALTVAARIDTKIEKGAEAVVIESRQPGDPPPSVRLFAPISGFVSAVNVAPGQPVTADDSLVEILDLSEVHAVAAVPEHLAGRVRVAAKARIRAPGFPDREFIAEIEHLGAEADAKTGTIEAAYHVKNPDEILRPGMRAEFSIVLSSRDGVMSIPREAVQGDIGSRHVFVRDYELENAFVKTAVQLGAQNDRFVEVTQGLLPGDEVVTRGAYALGFAGKGSISLKEALDAAHGHPHAEDGSELSKEDAAKAGTGGHAHADEHGSSSPLVLFLAGTSALLLILLVCSTAFRRKGAPYAG